MKPGVGRSSSAAHRASPPPMLRAACAARVAKAGGNTTRVTRCVSRRRVTIVATSIATMVTLLRLTHLVTLVVLPPAFATLAAHAARSIGGGEARCAAELDLPTPGFICAAGLDLLFSALVFTSFHLVIALPPAWWAATRRLSATRLLVQLTLVLVLLGTPMLWLRVGQI